MTNEAEQAALDAALEQIDRAFGKGAGGAGRPARVNMKVWMDPFTEAHVRDWMQEQVEAWLPDGFDSDKMWEDIGDSMANGDHRILEYHPFDRRYPPVTLGEWVGLFFRRLLGRFQRSEAQKWDAELARMAPAPPPPNAVNWAPINGDPPF